MPIDCTPQGIATDASCFTCQGEKQLLGMAVYLLAQQLLAVNPMADVSPEAIAGPSNCYTCKFSGKGLLGAIVYLLCQGAGGSGGTPQVFEGNGPPVGLQPGQSASLAAIYIDVDPGGLWYNWNTTTLGWA